MAAKKKKATPKKKALAKRGEAALATYDYGEDAGAGYEGTSSADFAIPFLSVLQTNSPECEKAHDRYLEAAEAGMLMDTVSRELIDGDEGVVIVPCLTSHVFTEWVPRDEGGGGGGGFRGVHETDSDIVKRCRAEAKDGFAKLPTGDGTELIETFYIFALRLDEEGDAVGFFMIPFTSTKIKVYRKFMQRLRQVKGNPPLFANRVRISSVPDSNKKGNFYNFKLEAAVDDDLVASLIPPVDDNGEPSPIIAAAKQFKEQIAKGAVRGAYESVESSGDDEASGDGVF